MKYICDAPDNLTWFQIETDAEAGQESMDMDHRVEKHFRQEWDAAAKTYQPTSTTFVERDIGLKSHIQRTMSLFLTLRGDDGVGRVTAKLPPGGREDENFTPIIVAAGNSDPYVKYEAAIQALAKHFGLSLDRERCFPYK